MLLAALRNPTGLRYLHFAAVSSDKSFRRAFHVHPFLQGLWKIFPPKDAELRFHHVTFPSPPGQGAMPVAMKKVVIDCKALRIALTSSPPFERLPLLWPLNMRKSGLPSNVKAVLRFALVSWPHNLTYIPLGHDLQMVIGPSDWSLFAPSLVLEGGSTIFMFKVEPAHKKVYEQAERGCVARWALETDPLQCVSVGFHGSFYGNWEAILRNGLGCGDIMARDGRTESRRVYMAKNFDVARLYCDCLENYVLQVKFQRCERWTVPQKHAFQSMFGKKPRCIGVLRMVEPVGMQDVDGTDTNIRYVSKPEHALLEYLIVRHEEGDVESWQKIAEHLQAEVKRVIRTQYRSAKFEALPSADTLTSSDHSTTVEAKGSLRSSL